MYWLFIFVFQQSHCFSFKTNNFFALDIWPPMSTQPVPGLCIIEICLQNKFEAARYRQKEIFGHDVYNFRQKMHVDALLRSFEDLDTNHDGILTEREYNLLVGRLAQISWCASKSSHSA